MDKKLEAVPDVQIDDGIFKYILIKVYGKETADGIEPMKMIVRGFERAEWHGKTMLNLLRCVTHINLTIKKIKVYNRWG